MTQANPTFDPPAYLTPRAAALWRSVVPSRARSPGRLVLIEEALAALDRAEAARLEIADQGLTTVTKTTGAVHLHPLTKIERESRAQFAKVWGDTLKFGWDQSLDGLPLDKALARMAKNDADSNGDSGQ